MEKGFSDGADHRRIRVALVSEHPFARAGMAQAILDAVDMELSGAFSEYKSLLAQVLTSPPDAVVFEMFVGGGEVFDALGRCRAAAPSLAAVILSHTRDTGLAERAIQAGVRGYLYRNADADSLTESIRSAVRGDLHVCHSIASPILQQAIYGKKGHKSRHEELSRLSQREFQVFQLLGSGGDNTHIATQLGISVKTLNAHKEHLKEKLALPCTRDLRAAAMEWSAKASLGS